MKTNETKKKEMYIGVSAVILVYAIYKLIELLIYFDFKYITSYIESFIFLISLLVLGILLTKNKNSLAISIVIGIVFG